MSELIRGAIYAEQAYAQGKMLDNSCWYHGVQACWDKKARILPRKITPSDLDNAFLPLFGIISIPWTIDNRGRIIFAEFSSRTHNWSSLSLGQHLLYQGLLDGVRGNSCAVLCQHNAPSDKQICTRHDVVGFHVMVWDNGPVYLASIDIGTMWERFVFDWFDNAIGVRRRIIGLSAGLKRTVEA